MSLLKQSLHLVAAVVVVTIQIIAQPIFFGVFGSTTSVESMILIAVMGGICLGQSGFFSTAWTRIVLTASGITLTTLGAFYSKLIFQGSQSALGEVLAGILIVLIVLSSGILSSRAIYLDSDIEKNYFWHNVISAFGIIFLFFIQVKLGNAAVCGIAGLALLLISFSHRMWDVSKPPLKIHWNSLTLASLGLGLFSGIYLSSVFEVMELSIFPSGFEFHVYLLLVFLHLAIARYLPVRKIKTYLIPVLACLVFALILVFCFGGIKDFFFFDPSSFILAIYPFPFRIAFFSFLQIFLLLIPYSAFAYVVPNRQLEVPNENHLFFVSLGNFLGFAVPGLILGHPPIELLLPLFFILSLIWWLFYGPKNKRLVVVIFLFVMAGTWIVLQQPSRRILAQSLKSRLFLTESVSRDNQFGLDSVQTIYRKEGKVGFVYKYNEIPGIGLGGYAAPMYSSSDLAKSLVTKDLGKIKKMKRVLILGLGNQLLLKYISILTEETGEKIEKVDVIDNFPAYGIEGFREGIGRVTEFNYKTLTYLEIHTDDVFKFLAKKKYSEPYDLIINNLTWPLYMSSRLTYTQEFYKLINEALTNEGVFVTRSFPDGQINCLTVHAFPFSESIRKLGVSSVILGSKSSLSLGGPVADQESCAKLENPNLSKLFWGQGLYDYSGRKRSSSKDLVDPRFLIYPMTGEFKKEGEAVGRAIQLFNEKYQKPILSFDSNSSDAFAQYLWGSLAANSANLRHKKGFSITPYVSSEIRQGKASSFLKPSCPFYKNYFKTFSSPPEALAVSAYSKLLKSYEIEEECYLP